MLLDFASQGFAPLQNRFSHRDAILGQTISTSDGQEGVCEGVDDMGVLLIESAQGRIKINSAEVSIRPLNTNMDA
jgi:BirA family biotin operon repressor/biotin-[acetyl-CoA-carboxylase] ligase